MTLEVKRSYLEMVSLEDLKESTETWLDYSLNLLDPTEFQLNKVFYKNVGKDHKWIDRLVWSDTQWIDYVSNKNLRTFIFKKNRNLLIINRKNFTSVVQRLQKIAVFCGLRIIQNG